jgi:hypothetical protein
MGNARSKYSKGPISDLYLSIGYLDLGFLLLSSVCPYKFRESIAPN